MPSPAFLRSPFTITYEVNPPRSADAAKALAHARLVTPFVDAVNLTDCPMSRLAMNPIPLAGRIQADYGLATIPHITCRDRNLLALQGELLGASFLGIRNVFALTGDPIKIGDHPETKTVFELYANQLIALVHKLNGGHDHQGQPLDAPTALSVGTALTLTDERPEALETFRRKLEAGADFFQTQVVFDPADLDAGRSRFDTDRPILVGTVPLRGPKMLETFKSIPGVRVPDALERRLKGAADFRTEANRVVLELADAIKGRFAGLHLMPVVPHEAQLLQLLGDLRGRPSPLKSPHLEQPV